MQMIDRYDTLTLEIALSKAKGMRAPVVRRMMERVGGLRDFFTMPASHLRSLSGTSSTVFTDSYREALLADAEKEARFVRDNNIDTVFLTSGHYPHRLGSCDDAPVLIYRMGSCDLDSRHMVGVVGTRHATSYGIDFTTKLVRGLANKLDNLVIVSGLAYGIDVAAHREAIAAGIPTVGVLAHPLNTIYPSDHRSVAAQMASNGGALVTEYPTTALIHRSNFLERNRIVAGLCDCLVVVESDIKGGSLSTARIAMQYNRDVFAVPGRVNDRYSRGTNRLISINSASMITDADELIEKMMWTPEEKEKEQQPTLIRALTADEQIILDYINAHPDSTINEMCVNLGRSYSWVSSLLMQLELDDFIITLPGGRYAVAI